MRSTAGPCQPWRAFLWWALSLSVLCVLLNSPHRGGPRKLPCHSAGYPWPFVVWCDEAETEFDSQGLLDDIAVSVTVVVLLTSLCAWSRRHHQGQSDQRRLETSVDGEA
jgi:hypothetical protein